MKKLFIAFLIIVAQTGYSQQNPADSIKQLLNTNITDTTRVLLLSELAKTYWYSNPDSSFIFAQQGYALTKQIKFEKGEAYCLRTMGVIFWLTGNYPKALEYSLQSLKKFESLNDTEGIIRVNGNIGIIYGIMGDHEMAIIYEWKSKVLAESIDKPDLLFLSLLNLGDNYEKLNQLDSARIFTNEAYEIAMKINDASGRAIALNNLGNIHSKMQQDEIAMGYFRKGLSELLKIGDIEGLSETTFGMAEIFRKQSQADSALQYARWSLAAAYEGRFTKRVLYASSFLSNYFKGLNILDSAYHYQEITIAVKDSLFSQDKVREVQNLSFTERIRQQEIAAAQEQAKEERKKNIQMLGIGTFITFFFSTLFYFRKRKRNPKIIKFLGLLGLLLLFEFIALFIHPYVEVWTNHTPVFMLLILVGIASILVPAHHKLEHLVREKLANKPIEKSISEEPKDPETD